MRCEERPSGAGNAAPSRLSGAGRAERSYEGEPRARCLLSVKDLKLMLVGRGDDAICGLLKSGQIPARKVEGKWATTPAAVEGWLDGITRGGLPADGARLLEVMD